MLGKVTEYERHVVDKKTGICYKRKYTEEHLGRCDEHNPEKRGKNA